MRSLCLAAALILPAVVAAADPIERVIDRHIDAMRAKAFVGTPAEVGAMLRALADELVLDEIVVNTWAHDPAVRRRSYELLAQEFALETAR